MRYISGNMVCKDIEAPGALMSVLLLKSDLPENMVYKSNAPSCNDRSMDVEERLAGEHGL